MGSSPRHCTLHQHMIFILKLNYTVHIAVVQLPLNSDHSCRLSSFIGATQHLNSVHTDIYVFHQQNFDNIACWCAFMSLFHRFSICCYYFSCPLGRSGLLLQLIRGHHKFVHVRFRQKSTLSHISKELNVGIVYI